MTTPKAGKDVEKLDNFIYCQCEWKRHSNSGKQVGNLFYKGNVQLPHDPAIALPGIYPRFMKSYVHTKTHTRMFIAAWFITAQNWKKKPRCLSMSEWMVKQAMVIQLINLCESPKNYAEWGKKSLHTILFHLLNILEITF